MVFVSFGNDERNDFMSVFLSKLMDIFRKPVNFSFLLAIFLTSLFLACFNFLPLKYLHRFHLEKFFNSYNYLILIVLFISFFLLIFHLGSVKKKKKEDKEFNEFYSKEQDKLFRDEDSLEILRYLYQHHPNAAPLPIYNQKVKLLEQYGLIAMASSMTITSEENPLEYPSFPYVLTPFAEEKLKNT